MSACARVCVIRWSLEQHQEDVVDHGDDPVVGVLVHVHDVDPALERRAHEHTQQSLADVVEAADAVGLCVGVGMGVGVGVCACRILCCKW